ncbi:MAG: hypothetical protein H3C47_02045 [Candidatus Cloacimonetes bacterium]|nr:hypothetical protein [Candidatus Cloacimonadota bacterium]
MKIYNMEVLHLIHALREDCLKSGDNVSGIDLNTLHQWEKRVLAGIPQLQSTVGNTQSSGFIEYLKQQGLEALIPYYIKKYPQPRAEKVEQKATFVPPPEEIKIFESQEASVGFLEKAWDYFREELTINWFLFLGAFMVFVAGLFYSLVWWDDFLPAQKYGLSLGVLLFAALMELILKNGMGLVKSPQIFMGIYAAFLPLVLMVHSQISSIGFLFTLVLGLGMIYRLFRVYAKASSWSGYGLAALLLSIHFVDSLSPNISQNMAVLVLAALGFVYYLFARLPDEHTAVRVIGAWIYLVAHFVILSPLVFVWIVFVLMLVQSLHTDRTKQLQAFVYGSYLMIALISLLLNNLHILHLATLFFSIRLHLFNFESFHPVRFRFMVLVTGFWILTLPWVYALKIPFLFEFLTVLYTSLSVLKSGGTGLGWMHLILFLFCDPQLVFDASDLEIKACLFGISPLIFGMRQSSSFFMSWDVFFGSLIISSGFSVFHLWMALLFLFLSSVSARKFDEFNSFVRLGEIYLVLASVDMISRYAHIPIWQTLILLTLSVAVLFLDHYRYSRPLAFLCMQIAGTILGRQYYSGQPLLFMQYWQILVFIVQSPQFLGAISSRGLPRDLNTALQDGFFLLLMYVVLIQGFVYCPVSFQYLIPGLILSLVYTQDIIFWSQVILILLRMAYPHTVIMIHTTQILALFFSILSKIRPGYTIFNRIEWFEALSFVLGLFLFFESSLSPQDGYLVLCIYVLLILGLSLWHESESRLVYLIFAQIAFLYPEGGFHAALLVLSTTLYLVGIYLWKGSSRSQVLLVATILNVVHYGATLVTGDLRVAVTIPISMLLVYYFLRPIQSLLIPSLILLIVSLSNFTETAILGPGFYLVAYVLHRIRHRSAPVVLLFTGAHLLTFAFVAASNDHQAGAIFSLAALSVYCLHMAFLRQMEFLVYYGFMALASLLLLLRAWGYIGGHGMLSYVLLFSSVLLHVLHPRLSGSYSVFARPLENLRDVLPILVLVIEVFRQDAPLVLLLSAFVLELYHREESFSYRRLASLFALNAALFLWARPSGMFIEVMSLCSGVSILWYAHTIRNQISKEHLRVLTVLGNLVFYSGGIHDFVLNSNIEALMMLWGFSFLGGWLAILFKARIQLFSSLGILLMSLIFFVIRQLLDQVSVGIPLVAGLGILLIVIGVILEKNRTMIQETLSRFQEYLSDWRS